MAQAPDAVRLVPCHQDPLTVLAELIIKRHQATLPLLEQLVVILPEPHLLPRFRQYLLRAAEKAGHPALLGPHVLTLKEWSEQHRPASLRVCQEEQRELILYQALSQYPDLINDSSPWHLSHDLLQLFDQLTLNLVEPAGDFASFTQQVRRAYGVAEEEFSALLHETRLVHTLWHAWHRQLADDGLVDKTAAYLLGLQNSLDTGKTVYLAGFHGFQPAELGWLNELLARQHACLILHGNPDESTHEYHPHRPINQLLAQLAVTPAPGEKLSEYSQCIEQIFAHYEIPLKERAQNFAQQHPASPLQNRLHVHLADNAENEARAISLQVRRWLLEGRENIGIVTENRRLARRVRALLDRADIPLSDASGWALSTTSAAAALARWLECLEEDFAHVPLLDLLKSPFIFPGQDSELLKLCTYRLENDIIRHENIARSLHRYRHHIQRRHDRLPWPSANTEFLLGLLDQLEHAALPVRHLLRGKHRASTCIQALSTSLSLLGMQQAFTEDSAGQLILRQMEKMQLAAQHIELEFHWGEFRSWLGQHLEQGLFIPAATGSPLQLLGLSQSRLQCFDALIIAGAELEHLPGALPTTPFFNNTVRCQLGLKSDLELRSDAWYHFRRLLDSAEQVLVTARHEENGEAIPLSPWLENIMAFHQLAYSLELNDLQITRLLRNTQSDFVRNRQLALPPIPERPAPAIMAELLPKRISPSSYQQLINCPYQFFVDQVLKLAPSEEVQMALSKSDYGERVHRCLEAFHSHVEGLPGPFDKPLNNETRSEAISLLGEIAHRVFARDVSDNFEHVGWQSRWNKMIPDYIDWQITRAEQWQVYQCEVKTRHEFSDEQMLSGRLDRIDKSAEHLSIIDYKTGSTAKYEDVMAGEAVQLPFYALLAEQACQLPVSEVAYLSVDNQVKITASVDADELAMISKANHERLHELLNMMKAGKELPAWGDIDSCQYCDAEGVCREKIWGR